MRCWLAAAVGEMLAAADEARAARAMIRAAESLDGSLDGERPPYLVFDGVHLQRWVGHTLVLLGDTAAAPRLRSVIEQMDASFMRAGAALHLDLSVALARGGVLDEAKAELAIAETLARRIGSRRQLERAKNLRSAS
jgi:hypothetical protein